MWKMSLAAVFAAFMVVRASAAQGSFNEIFAAKAREIPRALLGLGYTRFGSLDLETFAAHADGVHAELNSGVEKMNSNGRLSAHWQIVNGVPTVYVDQAWWNKFPEQQSVLALHEKLGALGYFDDQYWASVSMWFLSLPQSQQVLSSTERGRIADWIAKNVDTRLPKGTSVAGGVIGVGGGGEGGSLYVKMHGILRELDVAARAGSQDERTAAIQSIAHYLSSPLTVTWGNRGLK